jgi:periplasmic copper chaperone A
MNRRLLLQLAAALSLTVASILAIAVATRADAGGVEVRQPFARASIGPSTSGAVYLMLVNRATEADRLIAASTPAAARTDLHMIEQDGDVTRMRRLEAVAIPAGETVAFEPGGAHIMLTGLVAPLREGDSLSLTLEFVTAGTMTFDVPVKSIAAATADDDGEGHGGH